MSTHTGIKKLPILLVTGIAVSLILYFAVPVKAMAADVAQTAPAAIATPQTPIQPQATEAGQQDSAQVQATEAGPQEPAQAEATVEIKPLENGEAAAEAETPEPVQEIVTKPSLVVANADIMDIPSFEGNVVGSLMSGQTVNVYTVNVNNEWNAITAADGTMQYVHGSALALTAPYSYEYMSDLTRITGYTGVQLERALAGTGLEGLGAYYADKEKTHGINALFLIGIAKLESGGGTSSLARRQNNLGGLKNGRGGYMSFGSREECVEYMADLLKNNYLSESGKHYRGKTSRDVSIRYCEQSASWYGQVESLMKSSFEAIAA